MFCSMIVSGALTVDTLPLVWHQPDPAQWTGFAAIGIVGGVAQFFLFQAYRLAPASTVSPLEYTILAWSIFWGLIIWRGLPGAPSLLGILMIVVSGLALIRHERRNGRPDITIEDNRPVERMDR